MAPPPQGCCPSDGEALCGYICRMNNNCQLCPSDEDLRPWYQRFTAWLTPLFLAYTLAVCIDVSKYAHHNEGLDSLYTTILASVILITFAWLLKAYQNCMLGPEEAVDPEQGLMSRICSWFFSNLDLILFFSLGITAVIATYMVEVQLVNDNGDVYTEGKLLNWRITHQLIPVMLTYLVLLDALVATVVYGWWYCCTCQCCCDNEGDNTEKKNEKAPLKAAGGEGAV